MLEKVDLYARRMKEATKIGGIFSVVALAAAAAYGVWLVVGFVTQPPSETSTVQWADTNGPWPMEIR
jgi:ABC-type transporter Mla subunit MlaD